MQYLGKTLLCFILLQFLTQPVLSQELVWEDRESIRLINEADGYFIYDENYTAASEIYVELLKQRPKDHNLSYKLGVCYINITGKKKHALELLSYASEKYVGDESYSSVGEAAPFDVLYYLAFANQSNMHLEEAINCYKKYQNLLRVKEASEIDYINLQIKACRNAIEYANTNQLLKKELFAEWLSKHNNALHPVVSDNDSVFAFTIKEGTKNRIFCTGKSNGKWTEAVEITKQLGKYRYMCTNSITGNGKSLIISRNDGIQGDIYVSHFNNGSWGKIKKLGKTVNTKYWESHACIDPDGTILYFSSNRPGGHGSLDIYSASIDDKWNVGEARNLGPVINTRLEENTPYFDAVSNTLWFSSTGHEGFGGYDIFYSNYERRWSHPAHLPYPINTTSDDLNYVPYKQSTGLLGIPLNDTSRHSNIYIVSVDIKPTQQLITINGEVSLKDGLDIIAQNLELKLINSNNDSLVRLIPVGDNAVFTSKLPKGSYELIYNYQAYRSDTISIDIPESYERDEMNISHSLTPLMVDLGEYLAIRNILFEFDSYILSRDAMIELEKLLPALLSHQDLKISVRGYADAIGNKSYNLKLSESRAKTVVNYLVSEGIDTNRISTIAKGSSGFISDNTMDDGSDNPEGRKYNRRVSINILDNGYALPVESYLDVPRHIRKTYAYSFFVIIDESDKALPQGFFNKYSRSEFAFIKEIRSDDRYYYAVGGFMTRTDALCYLVSLRKEGFNESYIITGYELPGEYAYDSSGKLPVLYTIQIHALSSPTDTEFKGLKNLRVIRGNDGFYRYTIGEYHGYLRAKQALDKIRKLGYKHAFIKELSLLESQTVSEEK